MWHCRSARSFFCPPAAQVYKACLYGVHPVAVKVFQTQDDLPADDFWREISILRTCRHANIVQFQGTCVDGDTTMMVTELMDTDLYRALQCGRVSWYRHGLDVALDVAQALHFLHTRSIIHFDVKVRRGGGALCIVHEPRAAFPSARCQASCGAPCTR